MEPSLRRQIIEKIAEAARAMREPEYTLEFSKVSFGPLDEGDNKRRYTLGIVPQREEYSDLFPLIVRNLRIALEFRITMNKGDEAPGLAAEEMIADLESMVLANRSWGGLAVETDLVENEIDLDNYQDRTVFGVLIISVQYRHSQRDPRNREGSFGA